MKSLMDKEYIPKFTTTCCSSSILLKLGYSTNSITNSMKFYSECLSIPMYYELENKDQLKIIELINKIINKS